MVKHIKLEFYRIHIMVLYQATWKVFDDQRQTCMTVFASMNEMDDAAESQGVEVLGRWSDVGTASGHVICLAEDYTKVVEWLYNWIPMANITVKSICDDNVAREIVLGKKPDFTIDYSHVSSEPKAGETLFAIEYKFYENKRAEGSKLFANLTSDQDALDSGKCRPLGRWHDLGNGSGFAIAAATSERDVYAWANNWATMCSCKVVPVLTDRQTREVIRSKPGFEQNLREVNRARDMRTTKRPFQALCYPFFSTTPGHADGL